MTNPAENSLSGAQRSELSTLPGMNTETSSPTTEQETVVERLIRADQIRAVEGSRGWAHALADVYPRPPDGTSYMDLYCADVRALLAENAGLREALETFAIMANEDTDHLPDELVVSLTYDDTAYDEELGGPNTLLGERYLRAFRRARQALGASHDQ